MFLLAKKRLIGIVRRCIIVMKHFLFDVRFPTFFEVLQEPLGESVDSSFDLCETTPWLSKKKISMLVTFDLRFITF